MHSSPDLIIQPISLVKMMVIGCCRALFGSVASMLAVTFSTRIDKNGQPSEN